MDPKLVRAITQINVSVMSYYPQLKFFAFQVENSCSVIAHNTEQQCGLGFTLPLEESQDYPREVIYPQLGNHCFIQNHCFKKHSVRYELCLKKYLIAYGSSGSTQSLLDESE